MKIKSNWLVPGLLIALCIGCSNQPGISNSPDSQPKAIVPNSNKAGINTNYPIIRIPLQSKGTQVSFTWTVNNYIAPGINFLNMHSIPWMNTPYNSIILPPNNIYCLNGGTFTVTYTIPVAGEYQFYVWVYAEDEVVNGNIYPENFAFVANYYSPIYICQ